MAIVQISRIQHRKGLEENLPQLAGAELGWSVDQRKLYIGNGTLEEGAPVVGNTEILTEFSDILSYGVTYTYKGEAAGYTVQTGGTATAPVSQSLQTWLDQFASVKDFGAVGDGVTDDTAAINRALYQLFCREVNPQIRRSLFFPAGVYLVGQSIVIPTYATLYGEGINSSVIRLNSGDDSSLRDYVARTGDSLQQYGANIGANGATRPTGISIRDMGFEALDPDADIFLTEDASTCSFDSVSFTGPLTTGSLTTAVKDTAALRFSSTSSLVCTQISFDNCKFTGVVYGAATDYNVKGVSITNSYFDTLYQGVMLGTGTPVLGGPTGFRIMHNTFDNIYGEGIIVGSVALNLSAYNIFYDVSNHFNGTTNPASPVIDFTAANNVSVGDMFQRADDYATTYPRIELNNTACLATTNGVTHEVGTYARASGVTTTLLDNSGPTVIFTSNALLVRAFRVDYCITRNGNTRTGRYTVVASTDGTGGTLATGDGGAVENAATGVTFSATETASVVSFRYTASSTGFNGTLSYSVVNLA